MNKTLKTMLVSAVALVIVLFSSAAVQANAYSDPYDGVNRIGTYYQYQRQMAVDVPFYGPSYQYDYVAPPRAGGWFGSTSGWLTGLRVPVYTPVPPVHYTNYYAPVYGYPQWYGGYGYPRMTASQFSGNRERYGGILGY